MSKPRVDKWGNKDWIKNNKFHRLDGPACECMGGDKYWFVNGICHRLDGPAIEFTNGDEYWFINGINYTKDEYFTELEKHKTKEEIFILRLKYE